MAIVALVAMCSAWCHTACAVVDTLDGHIDDPANCCASVSRVHDCLARFTDVGHCKVAHCGPDVVVACRRPDGGVTDEWLGDGSVP